MEMNLNDDKCIRGGEASGGANDESDDRCRIETLKSKYICVFIKENACSKHSYWKHRRSDSRSAMVHTRIAKLPPIIILLIRENK
ncbi:hypothetical protein Sjap_019573 [Stephania japonica]|uniref:Uncharacterized protein n=1 Tax=Stephania japonica TaxID=461633 RepID=A0AAP0EZP4_9MAGN